MIAKNILDYNKQKMSNQISTTLTNVKDTDLKNDELVVKMELTQTVNRKAAHWLIMNWDTLDVSHGSYDPNTGKRQHDPEIQRNMFIKYFKQLNRDGTVTVDYKQNLVNGKPRARMLNKLPGRHALQSITRRVRQTICKDNQLDVDMANAHPSLLRGWCRKNNILCPNLDFYIDNREACLAKFPCSRSEAKVIMLAALNGQGLRSEIDGNPTPSTYRLFHQELNSVIREKVVELFPEEYEWYLSRWKAKKRTKKQIRKDGKDDVEAAKRSLLSMHMNDMENQALQVGVKKLNELGIGVASLIYDGLHIYKDDLIEEDTGEIVIEKDTDEVCKQLEKAVKDELGYDISWEIKPFKEPFDLPDLSDYDADAPIHNDVKAPVMDPDPSKHLLWYDFIQKYGDKVFPSEAAIWRDKEFIRDMNSVVRYIPNDSVPWVVYNSETEPFKRVKNIGYFEFRWSLYDKDGNIVNEKIEPMHCYLPRNAHKLPHYNRLVFKPHNHGVKRGDLNTFTGFKAKRLPDGQAADPDIIAPFFDHIKKVWANNDDEIYNYIVKWLSVVVQKPWERTNVFILLTSPQGVGKGVICEFLIERVFGKHCAADCAGLSKVTDKHNSLLEGKVFLNVNEMSDVNSKNFYANFDILKALITDNSLNINRKFIPQYHVQNCLNMIGCSNQRHTMNAEKGDRRILALECSDEFVGNHAYFDRLCKNLSDPETADHIITFLYDHESNINLKMIPMTALKQELEESSLVPSLRFLNELDEYLESKQNDRCDSGYFDESAYYKKYVREEDKLISKDKLYEWYKNWGETYREKVCSRAVFYKQIRNKVKKYVRPKIEGKRLLCVMLKESVSETGADMSRVVSMQ